MLNSATVVRPLHLHQNRLAYSCRLEPCYAKRMCVQAVKRGGEPKGEAPWWCFWRRSKPKKTLQQKDRNVRKRTSKATRPSTKKLGIKSSTRGSDWDSYDASDQVRQGNFFVKGYLPH